MKEPVMGRSLGIVKPTGRRSLAVCSDGCGDGE